jgi:hypothetical protein
MSIANDHKFLDMFSLAVGIFVGLVAGIAFIVSYLASRG